MCAVSIKRKDKPMIQIKKATMWKVFGGLALLVAVMAAALVLVPAAAATYDACGDGVCDPATENTDLCAADCECTDNGVAGPGEGCDCRDVVCATEKLRTACGTPCGAAGECPAGLACFQGVCWEDCLCEDICGPEEEPAPAACLANGAECTGDAECCSGYCEGLLTAGIQTISVAHCAPAPTCSEYGEFCDSDDDCCQNLCALGGGYCISCLGSSVDPCTRDIECCSGTCDGGHCAVPQP